MAWRNIAELAATAPAYADLYGESYGNTLQVGPLTAASVFIMTDPTDETAVYRWVSDPLIMGAGVPLGPSLHKYSNYSLGDLRACNAVLDPVAMFGAPGLPAGMPVRYRFIASNVAPGAGLVQVVFCGKTDGDQYIPLFNYPAGVIGEIDAPAIAISDWVAGAVTPELIAEAGADDIAVVGMSLYVYPVAPGEGVAQPEVYVELQVDTNQPPEPQPTVGAIYVVPHQLRAYAGHDTRLVLWVRDEAGRADLSLDAVTVVVSTYQGSKQLGRFDATASEVGEVAWTFPGSFARNHTPGLYRIKVVSSLRGVIGDGLLEMV